MIIKNQYQRVIEKISNPLLDIKKRELKKGNLKIAFLFISQLTDKTMLTQSLIKPTANTINSSNQTILIEELLENVLYDYDNFIDNKEEKILDYILDGNTVIIFSNEKRYIVVNIKKIESREINSPELTYTIRGARDCFNENLDKNLSLIRYRIKDPSLQINTMDIGRRTKTRTAVLHIASIANDDFVKEITKRLNEIDVDGIIDSGEIQNLLSNKPMNLFPQMGVIERSDMVAGALLEGKIVIIVEGSSLALVAPKLFSEFFTSCEDNYDNKYFALFSKMIRMYSTLLSTTITPLYVAIVSFHIDTLPTDFVLTISQGIVGVPFKTVVAAIILELLLELQREALLRVPKQIGPAIGIVGGIVIGQAAIAAKIFSPLMLIIASISLLSSFTAPDYTIMNPLRVLKYFLIFASASFGLIGFTLGASAIIITMISSNSLGIPYAAPTAPFNGYDLKNMYLYGKQISPYRPNFLKTKDNTRIKKKSK